MAVEEYGNGYRYRFRYVDPTTGKQRWATKGGFARKTGENGAVAAERRAYERLSRGESVGPSARTVAEWLDEFLASAKLSRKRSTASQYGLQARAYVRPRLGYLKLSSVTAVDLDSLFTHLLTDAKRCRTCAACRAINSSARKLSGEPPAPCEHPGPLASETVVGVHRFLVTLFGEAVSRGYLLRSPMSRVRRPQSSKPTKLVWATEQAFVFLQVADRDFNRPLWALALSTGMRRGELAGLKWDAVDLDGGYVLIRTQRLVTSDYLEIEDTPKTKKSLRSIPIMPGTVAILKQWREYQVGTGVTTPYVFTDEHGEPYKPQRITKMLQALSRRAGVPVIPLHNIRHTVATLLLAAGVHPKVVQEILGHSSIQITLDMYTQVPQETLRAGLGTLSAMLAAPGAKPLALNVGVVE